MSGIFNLTADLLMGVASATGMSYKEVNVLVWFAVIPGTWAVLLDVIVGKHWFKIGFVSLIFASLTLADFSTLCEGVFDRSVGFLMAFNAIGCDYVTSSVVVCLVVPFAVYNMLIYFALCAIQKGSTALGVPHFGSQVTRDKR